MLHRSLSNKIDRRLIECAVLREDIAKILLHDVGVLVQVLAVRSIRLFELHRCRLLKIRSPSN